MKVNYSLGAKELGLVLVVIALALTLVFVSSTREFMKSADTECQCGADTSLSCPHAKSLPLQSYAGFTLALILGGLGAFMAMTGMKYQEELSGKEGKMKKALSTLQGDEKNVCEIIKNRDGAVFQSELVEKSGLSKVKVSRILDKLEGKGLIERRRRGMTNLVILK